MRLIAGGTLLLAAFVAMAQSPASSPPLLKPLPAPPKPLTPTLDMKPQAPPAPAPAPTAAPRQFELTANERMSWVLVIGKPGAVDIQVRASGGPVTVTLTRPNGQTVERSGTGEVRVQTQATEQDIGGGQIWILGVRAPAGVAAGLKAADREVKADLSVVARGTVVVSHPPGDQQRAQAEAQQRAQKMRQLSAAPQQLVVEADARAMTQQAEARRAEQQRALIEQLRATLASGQPLQQGSAAARPAPAQVASTPGAPQLLKTRPLPATPPASSGSAAPVGSQGEPATAAVASISSLSVSRGVPGDPVMIKGTGFGAQQGTVRIAVAAGRALAAPVLVWSDTAVMARVPDESGIPAPYKGQLTIERTGAAPASAQFEFLPMTETRILVPQLGQIAIDNPGAVSTNVCHPGCAYGFDIGLLFFGHKGSDSYFRNVTLKNGWTVAMVTLVHVNGQRIDSGPWTERGADASIVEAHAGTSSPYVRVGWWHDAFSSVAYWPKIVIQGPKGVPHF